MNKPENVARDSCASHCSTGRWWAIVDFYDDSPATEFASLQVGSVDADGELRTDKQVWTVNGPGSRELWEKYNEIQYGECPYLESR